MAPSRISADEPNSPAYSKVRRKLEVRRILSRAADTIPCPSNGMDQPRLKAFIDLGAQSADVGLDNVRPRVEMNVPDVLEQHRAGDDLASVPHQVFEQSEFPWLQLDQLPATPHRARQKIELQIKDVQSGLCRGRMRSSTQRGDPRDELGKSKRLH